MKFDHALWTRWSFVILGSVTIMFGLAWGMRRWMAIVNWPVTDATVLKSRLDVASGVEDESSYIYTNVVDLGFAVEGKSYQVAVNDWGTSTGKTRHQAIADRYSVGSRHSIRYNPARPEDIYVEAGYTLSFFKVTAFCLGLGGLFAGLGVLLFHLGRR
jgi:Protein of unknown function (DUF3592)